MSKLVTHGICKHVIFSAVFTFLFYGSNVAAEKFLLLRLRWQIGMLS